MPLTLNFRVAASLPSNGALAAKPVITAAKAQVATGEVGNTIW